LKITARSQVLPRDKQKEISRVDIIVNGRPHRTLNARNGVIPGRRVSLTRVKGSRKWQVQAFDQKNDLVAVARG
jgi:hypothetical protein